MNVHCTLPPGWSRTELQHGTSRLLREGAELIIEITPLHVIPADKSEFLRYALVGGSPPDKVRVGKKTTRNEGWPMDIIEVAIVENGRLEEARVVVIIELLERIVALRIRASGPEPLATYHKEIMTIVDSVRPAWDRPAP